MNVAFSIIRNDDDLTAAPKRIETLWGARLGSRARTSEILNRKRHLTLEQIRAVSAA